jgi:RNA polymerase sigma factor (sigma-70 family)
VYAAQVHRLSWRVTGAGTHGARARRREAERKAVEEAPAQSVTEAAPPAESERVRTVIAQLPEQQRKVVTLRFIDDLPLDEVAEALEMTRNNAKTALARGIRRLREMLVPDR